MRRRLQLILAAAALVPLLTFSRAPSAPTTDPAYVQHVQLFLQTHCAACHNPDKAKAGFRIDHLSTDFSAPKSADLWKEVIDRVNAGEMPPPKEKALRRPTPQEVAGLSDWVNARLRDADLAAKNAGGRVPIRRLNRDEYANTIRDLLKLDENVVRPIVEDLPADGVAEGFDRLGVALYFDQTQIDRSLAVAEKLAALAIVTDAPKVNRFVTKLQEPWKRKDPETIEAYPSSRHQVPRGARTRLIRPDVIEFIQGSPTYKRELDGWGGIDNFTVAKVVTADGYYRVRVRAKEDARGRTTPGKFRLQYGLDSPIEFQQEVPVDPSGVTEAVVFLRGPDAGGEVKGPQVFRLLWTHTEKAVVPEPKFKALVDAMNRVNGELERAATRRAPAAEMAALRQRRDDAIKAIEAWNGPANVYNPAVDVEKLPRLLVESIEIEGPVQREWPPASHKALFFAGDERKDAAYAREIVERFLPRAYRRPVTTAEVDAIVATVEKGLSVEKLSFPQAMRLGLQRILCSPSFLFIGSPTQASRLSQHDLASRLSYFLWSTMPDEELTTLATAGKLSDKATLAAQTKRMLADPRAQEFVRNFAGQWLNVRDYGSVQPAAEYRDYDRPLEAASRQEPFEFFAEVLKHDLPVTNFLDSDFVVVNERLAKHYGIADVTGPEFRRVPITRAHHRGGVLGMSGLMTYLADGTRTLPMRRGTWVLRELFNDPVGNPPPNAGEIQPNAAGKQLSVRQRLELHRSDDVCASCHQKLDPYGLALENYDAIGAWRERQNGEGIRGPRAPTIDPSGQFPDGRAFKTLDDYKAGLMADKDKFARAFATKMLTYALTRPVGYTDHDTVDALVAGLKRDDYRIQSLIVGIVTSVPFNAK